MSTKTKNPTTPSKKAIQTDPILRKAHRHRDRVLLDSVCHGCFGWGVLTDGTECPNCDGQGEELRYEHL